MPGFPFAARRQGAAEKDERSVEADERGEPGGVAQNEVLELEAEDGLPSGELREGREAEQSSLDGGGVRTDEAEEEAGVVVGKAVEFRAGRFPRLRIESAVSRDESGQFQVAQVVLEMPVALHAGKSGRNALSRQEKNGHGIPKLYFSCPF